MAKRTGTVIYLEMTKSQTDEINAHGWLGSKIGETYLNARYKYKDIANIKAAHAERLYMPILTVEAENAEQVWLATQQLGLAHWSERIADGPVKPLINHFHGKARSMDVGDIIVWEDGEADVVDIIDFQKINWKEIEGRL